MESNLRSTNRPGLLISLRHSVVMVLLFLGIDGTVVSAQTLSISGQVIGGDSKERLPYANVKIKGTNIGTQTNLQGFFLMQNIPDSVFVVQATFIGYLPAEITVDPKKQSTGILITLEQSTINLEGVTVSAEQSNFLKTEKVPGLTTISPAQIANLPSVGQADVFRSLELLPGISATSDASSDLYVQGGTPDENLILFDGMTVYQVDHFFGFFSAFNPDAIKDVQIYMGGFPANFGGRLSSVIDIVGKTGDPDELHGKAGLSLLSGNATLSGPLLGGTFFLAARRSYSDIIASGGYNAIYKMLTGSSSPTASGTTQGFGRFGGSGVSQQQTPSSDFYDLNAKLSYNLTPRFMLSLSYYGSGDNYDLTQQASTQNVPGFASPVGIPSNSNNTKQENNGVSANLFAQWEDNVYSNVILAYDNYTSTYTSAQGGGNRNNSEFSTNEDNRTDDFSIICQNDWKLNSLQDIGFGIDVSRTTVKYSLTGNRLTAGAQNLLDLDQHAWENAAYVQDQLSLRENLTLTGGLRLENYSSTNSWFIEPRLSSNYQLSDNISVKAAFGIYHQFVNRIVNEDVTEGSRDFWVLADTSIPASKAIHYVLGAAWQNDGYVFDIEGFYKTLDNIAEFTQRFQRNAFEPYTFLVGDGRIRGIQALLQKKAGSFNGWISYTLMKAEDRFPQLNDDQFFPASNDQTHELKVVGSYSPGDDWNFSATFIYATGKPYTAPISQYSLVLLNGTTYSYTHVSPEDAYRLPDYQRLDISVSKKFRFKSSALDVGLSAFNVYNHTNISYYQYNVNTQPVVVTAVTGLGFLPSVFVQYEF
jgi:ferric enterobactin receptor